MRDDDSSDALWFCRKCKPKIMMSIQKIKELKDKIKKLEDNTLDMYEPQQNVIQDITNKVMMKPEENMEETADKEKRKNNLVIYNVPESGKDESR